MGDIMASLTVNIDDNLYYNLKMFTFKNKIKMRDFISKIIQESIDKQENIESIDNKESTLSLKAIKANTVLPNTKSTGKPFIFF